jgi:ABC-type uncharacterized transport system substrate-binding protein
MMICRYLFMALLALSMAANAHGDTGKAEPKEKKRIFVISSYHKDYLWSKSTQQGLSDAMLKYGYLDNHQQMVDLATNDYVESSKTVVQKDWMNTKRKHSLAEIGEATQRIMKTLYVFQPDLVMLGDDNAANYIGNQLLDTDTPVVFWGINGLPLKYGLVDSMDNPGHNITGIWQAGYHKESLELLKKIVPDVKTFAILSCDSVTSRPNIKRIRMLAQHGKLPLQLIDVVATNSFSEFQRRALELADKVDAFFVLNHDTFKDDQGNYVDMLTVGKWYLENIKKPEASHEDQFVREGMLLTANDSGYNQSYHAFEMAYDILEQGFNPSRMRTKTPPRGPLMVNRQRATMLGIALDDKMHIIDVVIPRAIALGQ